MTSSNETNSAAPNLNTAPVSSDSNSGAPTAENKSEASSGAPSGEQGERRGDHQAGGTNRERGGHVALAHGRSSRVSVERAAVTAGWATGESHDHS